MTSKAVKTTLAIIGIFCTAAIASCSSNRAVDLARPDVFSLFAGEWGENVGHTCESNPHIISFSDDEKLMIFKYQHPLDGSTQDSVLYHVLGHGDTWIAVRRDGETTLNHMNTPLAWKLYLTKDLNGYRWWLYGSVAWRKSLSRGIRCEPFQEKEKADTRPGQKAAIGAIRRDLTLLSSCRYRNCPGPPLVFSAAPHA